METTKEIILSMLTKTSVSVLTKEFITIDGRQVQVGENHRIAYSNNAIGRAMIQETLPEEYANAILRVWGITKQ